MTSDECIIILGSLSIRSSKVSNMNAASDDILTNLSVPIAGYQHQGGAWSDKKDMSCVSFGF